MASRICIHVGNDNSRSRGRGKHVCTNLQQQEQCMLEQKATQDMGFDLWATTPSKNLLDARWGAPLLCKHLLADF